MITDAGLIIAASVSGVFASRSFSTTWRSSKTSVGELGGVGGERVN